MRKAIAEYVELVGYTGSGSYKQKVQDAPFKLTQEEIAEELGISERDLRNI